MPLLVAPDEAVRRGDDLLRRAVVVLHQQHPPAGIVLLKTGELFGAGRAEAVDALVLVTDHEEISVGACQLLYDPVLDERGVLRLVNADESVFLPESLKYIRIFSEYRERIDHLIVVVHERGFVHPAAVFPVYPGELSHGDAVDLFDIFVGHHRVLDVGDCRLYLSYVVLGGVFPGQLAEDRGDHRRACPFVVAESEGGPAGRARIV